MADFSHQNVSGNVKITIQDSNTNCSKLQTTVFHKFCEILVLLLTDFLTIHTGNCHSLTHRHNTYGLIMLDHRRRRIMQSGLLSACMQWELVPNFRAPACHSSLSFQAHLPRGSWQMAAARQNWFLYCKMTDFVTEEDTFCWQNVHWFTQIWQSKSWCCFSQNVGPTLGANVIDMLNRLQLFRVRVTHVGKNRRLDCI